MKSLRIVCAGFVAVLGLLVPPYLIAQYSPDVFDLKKAQDLYDERGFNQGSAISVDGSLMVSNQNGNVSYSYPISSFTSGGHNVRVAMNYCGSVQFTAYQDYNLASRATGTLYSGWSRFHQNRPAWIMGVNGFAINVISASPHFHADPASSVFNSLHHNYDDADMIWTVDGYDVCNRMEDFGAKGGTNNYVDIIRLLRDDGSVMELMNVHTKGDIKDGNPDSVARLYTGTYFVNEANSHGYGIVDYINAYGASDPTVSYLTYTVIKNKGQYDTVVHGNLYPLMPRRLRYYPGDGTELVFREWLAPFGVSALKDDENRGGGKWGHPTIFYLDEINSSSGSVVKFQRSRHYPFLGGQFTGAPDSTRGRALTTSFTGHEVRFGDRSMMIEALGRTTKFRFDSVVVSGNATPSEKMPYASMGGVTALSMALAEYDETNAQLYKSFLGYITQVIDPEDRVTRFSYEPYTKRYQDFGFPHSNGTVTVALRNLRLKTVTEPAMTYKLKYMGNQDVTIVRGAITPQSTLNNMIDTVKKYDPSGGLLTTTSYVYGDFKDAGVAHTAWQWTVDNLTGQARTSTVVYNSVPLISNYYPMVLPSRHSYLTYTSETGAGVTTATSTSYTTGWGAKPNFVMLPISDITSINGIPANHQEFFYQLDTIRNFGGNTDLAGRYGMEIIRKITRTMQPDHNTKMLLVDTTTYLHLPKLDTTITWVMTGWDKLKSLANFRYLRDTAGHPAVVGKSWEEMMFVPPVAVFDQDTVTDDVDVPPIFGLQERSWVTDTAGAVAGKRNVYMTGLMQGDQRALRGKLLADSAFGTGGASILKGSYTYRHEITGELPASVQNALGVPSLYSYGYSFCDDVPFWEECSYTPPVGTILADDNSTRPYALQTSPFSLWFAKPSATRQYVRRYDGYGNLHTDTLTAYNEHTFHGLTSGTMDANGWYSRFKYDYNGRLNVAWLPYDFPSEGVLDTFHYEGPESIDLYGYTRHNRRADTIHCFNTYDSWTLVQGPELNTINPDTLYASLPVTQEPPCPCITPPSSRAQKLESERSMLGTCERNLPFNQYNGYKGFVGVLSHTLDSTSALKRALRLDSLSLDLMITSIYPQCVHLEVSIDSIFTKTFVHGCIGGGGDGPDGTWRAGRKGSGRGMQGITSVAGGYKLRVDLDSIASVLQARPYGSVVNIELRVKTAGATVAFINGTNAEDLRPRLNVFGEYRQVWDRADYTIAYEHDDASLKTTVRAKVDDALHTENALASQGIFIRRSEALHQFGAGYRLLNTSRTVVEPGATRRDTSFHIYSGEGARITSFDAEADSAATNYDDLGRPVKTINGDGTHMTMRYLQGRPDSLGITDQQFFGFCQVTVLTDEKGVESAQFKDAFGRLRREVADYGDTLTHMNLTTRYEYDLLGRLVQVTNPEGQATTYTHDAFGRIATKTQTDLGTVSYAYDDLGNVRFVQDQHQANKGLITYTQYDDLNRVTLVGEAYIDKNDECAAYNEDNPEAGGCGDGSRLTDQLDGNVLHVYGGSILTANRTMFMTPITGTTTFTALGNFRLKGCALNALGELGETEAPQGPFIMHPTAMYAHKLGGIWGSPLSEFEDVAMHPDFPRIAVQYDEMPVRNGGIWYGFPAPEQWDSLAPTGKVRNTKGRELAVAYRDKGYEPYHYTVMSYDERGRVEALLRWNENLGFDAVYYRYNSANQVTAVTVADPIRRFTTWYGYDQQGRTDSVWTKLEAAGTGLSPDGTFNNLKFPGYASHTGIDPDILYSYTRTDRVSQMAYPAVGVLVDYAYNHRKFLDSLVATRYGSAIFSQRLGYDLTGQIRTQDYEHGSAGVKRQEYWYDLVRRLTSWELDSITTGYGYDRIGNRQNMTRSGQLTQDYGYWSGTNRLWYREQPDGAGNDTTWAYSYNANGAQTSQQITYNTPWLSTLLHQEFYGYSFRGLMNRARVRDISGGVAEPWQDWRYRYNAGGEREQKRLYKTQQGVVPAPDSVVYPWVYYLLSGDKRQLALYHGQQLDSTQTRCGDFGKNRVYMYPHEYLTYGVGSSAMVVTRPDGDKEYKVVDHLGSTRAVINGSGGVSGRQDYQPFGTPIAVTGSEVRKTFIDKELDRETKLYNAGFRQYSPETGGFTSTDSQWELYRGHSPFQYALANPLILSDPSGATVTYANNASQQLFDNMYAAGDSTTKAKYDLLKNSPVEYHINLGGNRTDPLANGSTSFDFVAGRIVVNIKSGLANTPYTLGDELEMCYQFETGAVGFTPAGRTLGYDMQDEIDSKNAGIAATKAYNVAYGTNYQLEPQNLRFQQAQAHGDAAIVAYFNSTPYQFHHRGAVPGVKVSANLGVNGAPGATIGQLDSAVPGSIPGYALRIFNPAIGAFQTHRNP